MTNNNKGVYIPSIEAEQIYDMSVRGLENVMQYEYLGQIPYSLELIKMRSYKRLFGEKKITTNGIVKYQSDALINIKFKNKLRKDKVIKSSVRGYDSLMNRLNYQLDNINNTIKENNIVIAASKNKRDIDKLNKSNKYLQNKASLINGHIERIKVDKDNPIYHELKAHDLRQYLYTNGITFKGRKYVFYKRTASKSRQSQCLFILEDLHSRMKEWSHIGLDLTGKIDVASLLAYESLVSSSIIDTMKISPDSIFIINDEFTTLNNINAIEVGADLVAKPNTNASITNNIWDGQALIDISLMESIGRSDYGLAQLRQAFFKCAGFTTYIQKFLRDKHKEMIDPNNGNYDSSINPNYDEWKLEDAFGNTVNANQILLITTPSSLKFIKMAKGNEKKAFNNWKKHVKREGSIFGICQHEQQSKYGDYSYTSYQMVNTLLADENDIEELAEFEKKYIEELQGIQDENGDFNEQPFINYLEQKKDISNAYEMLADMYKVSPEVVRTKLFRDYRTKQISNYRTKVKGGKLRQEADYCIVVGSPYEMLLSVIGKLKNNKDEVISHTLHGDEIYTNLYDFNKKYTVVRNPHNSANNFHKVVNANNDLINKYFKFSKNIAVINTISSNIQSVMNGMDQDGDSILIFKSEIFNRIVDKTLANREYPVIINNIKSKPNPVELTNENIAIIDENTAKSQMWIGEVTNCAQYQVSLLWDILHEEKDSVYRQVKIDEVEDNIAVLVVLSNVAIDYSKKIVKVDIDGALQRIRKSDAAKVEVDVIDKNGKVKSKLKARKKPRFWKYVSTSDVDMENFYCPMDLLIDHINGIEKATYRKNLPLRKLLTNIPSKELKVADNKQIDDIVQLVQEFDKTVKEINAKEGEKKDAERREALDQAISKLDDKISKKSIKRATMYKLILKVSEEYEKKKNKTGELSAITVHLMNVMYRNHKKIFLNLFKK